MLWIATSGADFKSPENINLFGDMNEILLVYSTLNNIEIRFDFIRHG